MTDEVKLFQFTFPTFLDHSMHPDIFSSYLAHHHVSYSVWWRSPSKQAVEGTILQEVAADYIFFPLDGAG